MALVVFCLLVWTYAAAETAGQFGAAEVLGTVSAEAVTENSGLAASRKHPGILYGLNDHGDTNRIFAMDPISGHLIATLTIEDATNIDWEDLCVGTCGQGESGTCIYIGDIGDGNHDKPRTVYKVREPALLNDTILQLQAVYKFRWGEDDAESLMIDPQGELYIISKVHGGDALFARLPQSGWGSVHGTTIPSHNTARLRLHTSHNDPQGADLSPDGTSLLVKTEEGVLFYAFSTNRNYVSEMAALSPQSVSTYIRRKSGESVAWNPQGTGFYTLPEGNHPVFNYYAEVVDIVG